MLCSICNSESSLLFALGKDKIISALSHYYDESISDELCVIDYQIFKCSNCELVYCSPMQPGNDRFYNWITSHQGYYPGNRWEWNEVVSKVSNDGRSESRLLEIGCGSGDFLELLQKVPFVKSIGIDTTSTSIDTCKRKGLEAYCTTLESIQNYSENQFYDYIVSFHCLEHVNEPKMFVAAMQQLLNPSGRIYLSTPYSPMSFETIWFDPLNYPPHHLTRWNVKAYRELATQLNLKINFYMPNPASLLKRSLYAMNLQLYGPAHAISDRKMLCLSLLKPNVLIKELRNQNKRDKCNGQCAADVILVELYR